MEMHNTLLHCLKCQKVYQYYDYLSHTEQCSNIQDLNYNNNDEYDGEYDGEYEYDDDDESNTNTNNNNLYNPIINRGFYPNVDSVDINTMIFQMSNIDIESGLGAQNLLHYGHILHILEPSNCVICFNIYDIYSEFYTTNCNHSFCLSCSKKWFDTNSFCPLCKTNVKINAKTISS